MRRDLPRSIGFWGGSAIMVGIIIGSGIFRTPPAIAKEMGSPTLILSMWAIGGVLSLFGALSYAELGTMFPRSGGLYVFLYEGLGEVVAFIFGWTYMFLGKPLAAAGIATVFSEHFNRLFGLDWSTSAITCVLIILLTGVNTVKVQLGASVAIVFTGLKVLALAAIVAAGIGLSGGHVANLAAIPAPKATFLALAPVLASVLWAYDGWSDIASCAGEIRNPQKTLPRILLVGTAVTVLLYVAVNAVFMSVVPLAEMRTTEAVAPLTIERLIGRSGDRIVTIIICISTLGATHASIIAGARVTFAQARDGLFFRSQGHVNSRFQTPDVSLWTQCTMSCFGVVAAQTFERMIGGFIFAMWIFFALAALSVVILRVRRPKLHRPYRCWGYPVVPLVFVLSALFMTVLSILDKPVDTLIWIGILAAGVPGYYVWRRFVPRVPIAEYEEGHGFPVVSVDPVSKGDAETQRGIL